MFSTSVDSIMAPIRKTVAKLEAHAEKQFDKADKLREDAAVMVAKARVNEAEGAKATAQLHKLTKLLA